ncbi:hypothetical protein J6590_002143 [Homalodisca vitripennis]|nr:hypothetical protein J6590_002143 [Homalodisca vitripennis]
MNSFTGLIFLSCLLGSVWGQCQECPQVWQPVCGYSGTKGFSTFPSFCTMNLNNQCYKGDYRLFSGGMCQQTGLPKGQQ